MSAGDWSRQHGGKWSEAIARCGHFIHAPQVRPHELEGWLEARLRQRGVRFMQVPDTYYAEAKERLADFKRLRKDGALYVAIEKAAAIRKPAAGGPAKEFIT